LSLRTLQFGAYVVLQKFVLSVPQISTFSDSQQNSLTETLANQFSIDITRINITQPPNDEYVNKNGQLIFSISNSNDTSDAEPASLVYNITQIFSDKTALKNFFSSANITPVDVLLNTLTFNESVGTAKGCYAQDGSGLFNLLINSNVNCYPSSPNGTTYNNISSYYTNSPNNDETSAISVSTGIIIAVVVAIFSSVVILFAILMIIPGTRYAIFPKLKIRHQIKERINQSEMKEKN